MQNFGKLSKYEYEKMRQKYQNGITNINNNDLHIGKITQKEFFNNNLEIPIINYNLPHLQHDTKIINNHEKINISSEFFKNEFSNANNKNKINFEGIGVFNENLFKNRKISNLKIKKLTSNQDYKEMNQFNLNILHNNKWGLSNYTRNDNDSLTLIPIKPNKNIIQRELGNLMTVPRKRIKNKI